MEVPSRSEIDDELLAREPLIGTDTLTRRAGETGALEDRHQRVALMPSAVSPKHATTQRAWDRRRSGRDGPGAGAARAAAQLERPGRCESSMWRLLLRRVEVGPDRRRRTCPTRRSAWARRDTRRRWPWLPAAVRRPRRAPPGRGMRGVAPGIAAMARRADALTAPGTVPRTRDLR